ncbi:MAG: hypothetical protein ACLR6H_10770 [Roseburia sp.]
MAIKEDKSFTGTQIGYRSLLLEKGHGVSVSTARCLSKVLNCFIQLSKNTKKKIVFPIYRVGKEQKRNQYSKLFSFPVPYRERKCHSAKLLMKKLLFIP